MGRDSLVGIATRYQLNGSGLESRWERDFPHPSRTALEPSQSPVQWVPCLSRGYGRGVAFITTSPSAEVKERLELYLYSPSGPSWSCSRVNFTLDLPLCKYHSTLPPWNTFPWECNFRSVIKEFPTPQEFWRFVPVFITANSSLFWARWSESTSSRLFL
jgi:hypothetical protein